MAASKAARATPALIRRDPPKSFATGERHQPSKAETKSTQADELAAFLSLHWRNAGNGWRLYGAKDGRHLADEVARIVIANPSVAAVGDALWADATSQTWRYVSNE